MIRNTVTNSVVLAFSKIYAIHILVPASHHTSLLSPFNVTHSLQISSDIAWKTAAKRAQHIFTDLNHLFATSLLVRGRWLHDNVARQKNQELRIIHVMGNAEIPLSS